MTQNRAERWRRLVEAVRETYGYATAERLRQLGFSRHRIDHLAATGSLESVSYGLYRVPASPTSWKSKLYRLTLETRSAASHLSGAIMFGLGRPADLSPGYAEATATRRSRRAPEFAHRLYLVRGLDVSDRVVVDAIPCLPIDRTLLDIAAEHGTEPFVRCFNEAVRRRLTSLRQLRERFASDPPRRGGTPAIRSALDAVADRAVPMSEWSRWAADRLGHAGVPEPQLEAVLTDRRGRRSVCSPRRFFSPRPSPLELSRSATGRPPCARSATSFPSLWLPSARERSVA